MFKYINNFSKKNQTNNSNLFNADLSENPVVLSSVTLESPTVSLKDGNNQSKSVENSFETAQLEKSFVNSVLTKNIYGETGNTFVEDENHKRKNKVVDYFRVIYFPDGLPAGCMADGGGLQVTREEVVDTVDRIFELIKEIKCKLENLDLSDCAIHAFIKKLYMKMNKEMLSEQCKYPSECSVTFFVCYRTRQGQDKAVVISMGKNMALLDSGNDKIEQIIFAYFKSIKSNDKSRDISIAPALPSTNSMTFEEVSNSLQIKIIDFKFEDRIIFLTDGTYNGAYKEEINKEVTKNNNSYLKLNLLNNFSSSSTRLSDVMDYIKYKKGSNDKKNGDDASGLEIRQLDENDRKAIAKIVIEDNLENIKNFNEPLTSQIETAIKKDNLLLLKYFLEKEKDNNPSNNGQSGKSLCTRELMLRAMLYCSSKCLTYLIDLSKKEFCSQDIDNPSFLTPLVKATVTNKFDLSVNNKNPILMLLTLFKEEIFSQKTISAIYRNISSDEKTIDNQYFKVVKAILEVMSFSNTNESSKSFSFFGKKSNNIPSNHCIKMGIMEYIKMILNDFARNEGEELNQDLQVLLHKYISENKVILSGDFKNTFNTLIENNLILSEETVQSLITKANLEVKPSLSNQR